MEPGGGEMNGKLALWLTALGAFGGGSRDGASGEGGAGHCLPLVAEAPLKRFRVRV